MVLKTLIGLGNDESAQKLVDVYRNFRNFVGPHMALPSKQIPAEAADIDLNVDTRIRVKT